MAVLLPTGTGLAFLGHRRALAYAAGALLAYCATLVEAVAAIGAMAVVWLASFVDTLRARPAGGATPAPWWRMAAVAIGFVVLMMLAGLALKATVVATYRVPAESMAPTLEVGDIFVVDRRAGAPMRGDVIVFAPPSDPSVDFVKRVVALPGDEVSLHGGLLTIDGKSLTHDTGTCTDEAVPGAMVPQSCILAREGRPDGSLYTVLYTGRSSATFPDPGLPCPSEMGQGAHGCRVPEGMVFVMGDNRDNSYDSRYFGPVPIPEVKGRARQIYFSWGDGRMRWDRIGLRIQ
jgi:signal peptidase I